VISDGRMTLGIGLGGREDDYGIAGVDTSTRGRGLDAMLERIREVWEGEEMGPEHPVDPRILVGGSVEASFERAARFGDGWIAAFADAGCDELYLFPSSSDPAQVDLLADAAGL
jgi:alkanesulfonate monooxygenase SsuD/methylene tetrahydromethanopterin reductase-like flavin-dependent oxidoreductase (luciferase family)